jgi:polyphenol oxidase
MPNWYWQDWNGLPYLRCSLLDAWPHGFFTQRCWPRHPTDLVEVLDSTAAVYHLKQVHGNRVWHTQDTHSVQEALGLQTPVQAMPLDEGDGLIGEHPQRAIWVSTADCTPVLIGDAKTGRTAALHAGWRGTATQIVPTAIAQLQGIGSQLEHLRIALGPAIAGEVYQVGRNVALAVGRSVVDASLEDAQVLEQLQGGEEPALLPDPHPDRLRLDVRRINLLQLYQLGIRPDQVSVAPYCTYQNPEYFFSYRRTQEKKVQWSGIVSS